MNRIPKTNSPRVQLFLQENDGWQQVIKSQSAEIPAMKSLLDISCQINENIKEEKRSGSRHFQEWFLKQEADMAGLVNELAKQQNRLEKNAELAGIDETSARWTQDILRERIKEVEKTFIDLKCNFMNYLSGVL